MNECWQGLLALTENVSFLENALRFTSFILSYAQKLHPSSGCDDVATVGQQMQV